MEAFKIMERTYFNWKGKSQFLKVVKNPTDTQAIFKMNAAFQKAAPPEMIEQFMKAAYQNPVLEKAYQDKYWPHLPKFEELERMPEGSFGRAFASFIVKWNLDKDIFPEPKLGTRQDYLTSRVYQAHDAWHVLTGYTPSIEDELGLQAFGVGQYQQALSVMIISGGFLHLLNNSPERAVAALDAVSLGYKRGRSAKHLLAAPVLERLMDPLEEVRKDLGIEPLA